MLLELLSTVSEGITTVQQFATKLNMDIDLLQYKIDHCITVGYLTKQYIDRQKSFLDDSSSRKSLSSFSCKSCPFSNNCSSVENDNQILVLTPKGERVMSHLSTIKQS